MINKKLLVGLLILVLVIGFTFVGASKAGAQEQSNVKIEYGELDIISLVDNQIDLAEEKKEAARIDKLKTTTIKKVEKQLKKYQKYMSNTDKKKIKIYINDIKKAKTDKIINKHCKKAKELFSNVKKYKNYMVKWTSRIDKYLKGSKMSGCGEHYAAAAYKNNIDPRWAPAISCVESGKGAAYISSTYNVWGWGGGRITLGSSWESSIHNYVKQLKDGYGYTLSMRAANKYCDSSWYYKCATEIAKI